MRYLVFSIFFTLGAMSFLSSCNKDDDSCTEITWFQDADSDGLGNPAVSQKACDQPSGYVSNNTDTDDTASSGATLHAAFAEFDDDNTDIYLDGTDVVIETNGLPNHTSVYWGSGHALYLDEPDVATTPSIIPNYDASASLTVSTNPQLASSPTSTQLGAIGIAVSGAAIFNDSEGNGPLSDAIVSLDYAGAHIGPSEYHYHLEPIPFSEDDDNLVGIMADGFFIYGRKCNSTNDYPTDLDASGGHSSTTQHNSDGEYHYHIINEFYTGSYILLFGGDYQGTPSDIN